MATNWKAVLLASMIATSAFGARNVLAAPLASVEQASLKDIGSVSADRQAAIREAVSLGLISGYPNGEFKPEESLTRTQLAVLLAKALHLPLDTNAESSFKDVASDSWSTSYIEAVRKAGLMNGTDTGFDPNRKVTRQELASVFVRAVNGLNTTGGLEMDPALASGTSGWAAASVQAALRLGLMTPEDDGFQPKQAVARADIAQLLVDIFAEKELSAVVTKVDGDVIMADGKPLLVSDKLKQLLLAEGNKEALSGAKLRFKSAVRSVNALSELEIVATGTAGTPVKLDTTGMPVGGTLKVSGDYIAINGGTIKNLILQNQAANVSVDASVDRLELMGQAATLSGKGAYREIQISDPRAKLTIGGDVRIDRLVLPEGIALADIVTNLSQVQSQIGSIVSASGVPVTKPSAPVSYNPPTVADKSALGAAIADASGLADTAVAGKAEGQYPQSAIDALKEAVEAAGAVKADIQATQSQVDSALATLRTAINVFKNAVVHVGTTLLDDAIADALGYANASVAGGAEGQYPQGAIDALKEAIEAAEAVKADIGATQTAIDGAAFTLREVIDTFKNAVVHINLTQLNAAIAAASGYAGAAVAGGAEGQYPQSAIDALNDAIEASIALRNDAAATQAGIDSAESTLQDAIDTFNNAVVHIDLAQLDAAIADASNLADAAAVGDAEGQYPQSAIDALNDAIETSIALRDDPAATQAGIDSAESTLQDAIDTFNNAVVHIDLTQLDAAIADASNLADTAVVGTLEGQYPQSAIDALNDAIEAAEEAKGKAGATQSEIDSATGALQNAITAFQDAESHSLKASLEGRPFYLNSGRTGTTGDTVLSADSYEQYNKRNIKNYLKIKRGAVNETIEYDDVNNQFTVTESGSGVVGTITVESTSPLVELTPGTSGITVHPLDAATESTEAALVFHVKEGNEEVSQVTLPIVMDETAPILSSSVYGSGQFTLTANEMLTTAIMGYSMQVQFSQSGNAVDFQPLTANTHYSVSFVDKRIIITLTAEARSNFVLQSSSKFKITMTGITDNAGNDLYVDTTIDVPQY
ncbi:S-layer homology domain-containing protein [Cohnella hashimotonis]|uniref:S-layer homology domain-containing protein n=1 Tax=Cohnella hashimotonis TaxID=2826895 RepID=A0ABT6TVB3_9BACL|nr:S-layer homology domain-containing protein [Cohnella hashimotonis]MDI4649884.1 S-layer homology domain-containing protein [Cohnella hashimotonis]